MKQTWTSKFMIAGVTTAAFLFATLNPVAYAETTTAISTTVKAPLDAKELEAFADQFFAKNMKDANIPGLSLAVVKDGKVLLKKGYGLADIETKTPMDPDKTVQRVASISKMLTVASVMQLVEQGKLDLNTDINEYLGDIQFPKTFDKPITLESLLTHTSGFGQTDDIKNTMSTDLKTVCPLKDAVSKIPQLVREPGEAFQYDNYGFDVAGYIVEKVSGKPFEKYVEENLFKPLGMKNSSFDDTKIPHDQFETLYNSKLQPHPAYVMHPTIMPSASLTTTGDDMAKFMIMLLNKGTYNEQQLLTPESIANMEKVHYAVNEKNPVIGLGFEQQIINGYQITEKGGDLPGGSSAIYLIPEENVGIYLSFNRWSPSPDPRTGFINAFMDQYFPDKPTVQPDTYLNTPKDQLSQFAGTYSDIRWKDLFMNQITVTGDGELTITGTNFGMESSGVKLRQVDTNMFVDPNGTYVTFKEDSKQQLKYMNYGNITWNEKRPSFSDVPAENPYSKYINSLYALNLVQGKGDGKFDPTAKVTRGEFVSILVNMLKLPVSSQPVVFGDAKGSVHASAIQTAYENGLVVGTSATTFSPDASITREQGAAMIWNVLKNDGESPLEAKLSGETSAWANTAVQTIVAHRLYGPEVTTTAEGVADYKSKNLLNRQESAALLDLTKIYRDNKNVLGLHWFQ